MAFKITIVETKMSTKLKKDNYTVIGERLISQADLDKAGYDKETEKYRTAAQTGNLIIKEYGYAPSIEVDIEIETKVYEQAVESLDLKSVISAINK